MAIHVSNPILRLFKYLSEYKNHFYYSITASIINKVLDLMPPVLVAWVIDTLRKEPPEWLAHIFTNWFSYGNNFYYMAVFLAILAVLIFAFESLFQWMYQSGFMKLAQKVQHKVRTDSYNHIQKREMAFFEEHRLGNTLSMLNDDVNQLERFLNTSFNEIIQTGVVFLFAGSVMLSMSWELAIPGLIAIPFIIFGSFYYQKMISPRYKQVRESVGTLNSRLENNISGVHVIQSFTAEKYESKRVERASEAYMKNNFHAIKLNALYVPLIRMGVALGFGGVLLLGSYWVIFQPHKLSIGELVFFSMMIQRMLWPLTSLGKVFDEYQRAKASAQRTFSLLDTESKIKDAKDASILEHCKGEIDFKRVNFSYANHVPIFKKLSFHIKAKQSIGIAGVTGSGKTSLIKLLLRFYDINSGKILIDQQEISFLSIETVRKNIALVSQDIYLFHGSIKENIMYGNKNISEKELIEAGKLAQLHSFIQTLPKKYNTIIGERGLKLSGGQRQRLSIARAIIKHAPILILDEATSSVDTETEKAIKKNLSKLIKGKTAIVIAHRLSTIKNLDKIFVLGKHAILEEGTHNSLLKKKGAYAKLWNIQLGDI